MTKRHDPISGGGYGEGDVVIQAVPGQGAPAREMLAGLVAEDGSAGHPHIRRLLAPRASRRDLADAVHALCTVHGGHPGMIDDAHAHCAQPEACDWMEQVAEAFAGERGAIALLTAAVGPLPSTPGQAESEAALTGIRHALCMLARSDRGGCATGAAAALVADWAVVRAVLGRAADSVGIGLTPPAFPSDADTAVAIARLSASAGVERAMVFGARQLLAQHRGLWDLLEARAAARAG